MVSHGDLRGFSGAGVAQGRIGSPCLTSSFEMALEAAPFIPLKGAVSCNEEQSYEDQDDGADFCGFEQIMSEVVNDGCI